SSTSFGATCSQPSTATGHACRAVGAGLQRGRGAPAAVRDRWPCFRRWSSSPCWLPSSSLDHYLWARQPVRTQSWGDGRVLDAAFISNTFAGQPTCVTLCVGRLDLSHLRP